MGTIAEKLRHLAETKTAIKNAITAKGVAVSERDTFRSYAAKIELIKDSSSELDDIKIPSSNNMQDIYFRVDFVNDSDSINVMINGENVFWYYELQYNHPDCFLPPTPGSGSDVYTQISFDTLGFLNQALVHINVTSQNWTLHITSGSPDVKITFLSKDYYLTCNHL
ncbi:hypothetical protein [Clostridium sp. D33t1_170424_F3]|uniref:hypothetical protein n=1 Tax=Clostridium sp. D33t1_170424_F3 TaxID=2787099 RepID=UPI0018AA101A|nr:hypothetical protein [Clostridium sp. D33t1_170424_F3]